MCNTNYRLADEFVSVSPRNNVLPHWGRDKMAAISQTILSSDFSIIMKIFEFRLRFHWNLLPRPQLTNIPSLVQIMAWHRPGNKPLSEPMLVSLPTHICITRPQWVKFRVENCSYFNWWIFVNDTTSTYNCYFFKIMGLVKLYVFNDTIFYQGQ